MAECFPENSSEQAFLGVNCKGFEPS